MNRMFHAFHKQNCFNMEGRRKEGVTIKQANERHGKEGILKTQMGMNWKYEFFFLLFHN
jgi:hypothetical protein